MVKNFTPRPFDKPNPLPTYVSNTVETTLLGAVQGGYVITLAKLTVGDSVSAGNPLTHALFESYNDHGERMSVARTRVSGHERKFTAVKSAMIDTGIEFFPIAPCSSQELLTSLGDWFRVRNPEITSYSLVSQTCH